MHTRRIWLFWLLLLLPTLVAGGVMMGLIGHERERLEQAGARAAEGHARLAAETLSAAVATLQDAFTARLLALPPDRPEDVLRDWPENEPLVRHVFVWQPGGGLRLPNPAAPATREEALFLARYDALFSGREPFAAAPARPAGDVAEPAPYSARQTLATLSKIRARAAPAQSLEPDPASARPRTGWMPWFWESRLHWLGWVQPRPDAPVVGVELESAALLASLLPALQQPPPDGLAFVLRDGRGAVMHQAGEAPVNGTDTPLASAPVGPALPHWTIEAYTVHPRFSSLAGGLFTLTAGLLVAVFMAAILAGGGLLLRQALQDRRDALRKTTFVSNVSHELRTPLTTLRLYAEILAEGRTQDPAKIQRYLHVMITESERLTRLINNVLDFSRLERGRRAYRLETLDAAALARDVLDGQSTRLQEAGLAVTARLPDTPVAVRADRDALAQVLLNLLDNAAKYAAHGGALEIALETGPAHAVLRIADRGPGIPPDHRRRLFDQFHRVDDALTATQPGCGLGLSISRRLMRDMGGELRFEPAPGGGAAFLLEIPRENENHPDRRG